MKAKAYPHPLGEVKLALQLNGKTLKIEVDVPSEMQAVFKWKGHTRMLKSGHQVLSLTALQN